jgi:type I restriction enzyme R subunit
LDAAIRPVANRLLTQYKTAQAAHRAALATGSEAEATKHKDAMAALIAFKADMGQFIRLYVFLSQIFNFESEEIEKRWIFYRLLLRLLDFERERDQIDLSKVKLTHHTLRKLGTHHPNLTAGDSEKLQPITAAGTGSMQEKVKARLREIIERVNELFEGELTDDDKLIYVNNVLVGKLLESRDLQQQAANNTRARFVESPDLESELINAVIAAQEAHQTMSQQALADRAVMRGLLDIVVRHTDIYDRLRERAGAAPSSDTERVG